MAYGGWGEVAVGCVPPARDVKAFIDEVYASHYIYTRRWEAGPPKHRRVGGGSTTFIVGFESYSWVFMWCSKRCPRILADDGLYIPNFSKIKSVIR